MNECAKRKDLFALYEGGEASAIGKHIRECPSCRKQAEKDAPELLFALLADQWRDVSLRREKQTGIFWAFQPVLRLAASALIVLTLATAGYFVYEKTNEEFLMLAVKETDGAQDALRARYPLIKEVPKGTQYYLAELSDGTRMVYFYVADL